MSAVLTLFIPEPPAPEGVELPPEMRALVIADTFWAQYPYPAIAALKAKMLLRTDFRGGVPVHLPELGHCWVWGGSARDGRGRYGGISFNSRRHSVHKIAWRMYRGEVPSELTVDHRCRNRWCWRPGHLQILTRGENSRADHGRGDLPGSRTHCPQNHPYDEDNTYIEQREVLNQRTGEMEMKFFSRQCWTCRHARDAARAVARRDKRQVAAVARATELPAAA